MLLSEFMYILVPSDKHEATMNYASYARFLLYLGDLLCL
jgi:hypothetical protein